MKIFNWMHQKLQWSAKDYSLMSCSKDGLHDEEPKPVADEVERDTEALLLRDMLDGFLTIGTLGLGHPVFLPSIQEEEEEDPQPQPPPPPPPPPAAAPEEEEGLTAAIATSDVADQRKSPAAFKPTEELDLQLVVVAVLEDSNRPSIEIQPLLKEGSDNRRTTLADLFAADAIAATHADRPSIQPRRCCMAKCMKKPMKKEKDSTPQPPPPTTGKKLQRLMRMLKRKRIHPDVANVKGASDPEAAGEDDRLLQSKA